MPSDLVGIPMIGGSKLVGFDYTRRPNIATYVGGAQGQLDGNDNKFKMISYPTLASLGAQAGDVVYVMVSGGNNVNLPFGFSPVSPGPAAISILGTGVNITMSPLLSYAADPSTSFPYLMWQSGPLLSTDLGASFQSQAYGSPFYVFVLRGVDNSSKVPFYKHAWGNTSTDTGGFSVPLQKTDKFSMLLLLGFWNQMGWTAPAISSYSTVLAAGLALPNFADGGYYSGLSYRLWLIKGDPPTGSPINFTVDGPQGSGTSCTLGCYEIQSNTKGLVSAVQ